MKKVKVIIKNADRSGFAASCLWELNRAGTPTGSIVEGNYRERNKAVEFTDQNGNDCVAWVGITCELITD